MADSLLQMCQDVTDEIGIERPSTIIGNTNDTARRILQTAKREGRSLLKTYYWSFLAREHTFTTVDSQASYSLPSDFDRIIPHTQWDRSNEWRLWGPLSPQEWQFVKSGVAEEGPRRDYRIKANSGTNELFVSPTPDSGSAGETLVFEYITDEWAEDSGGTGKNDLTADTDTVRFDDELFRLGLIWRFKRALGMEYITEFDEYERLLNVRKAGDGDMPRLRMDLHFWDEIDPVANIQDANFPSS